MFISTNMLLSDSGSIRSDDSLKRGALQNPIYRSLQYPKSKSGSLSDEPLLGGNKTNPHTALRPSPYNKLPQSDPVEDQNDHPYEELEKLRRDVGLPPMTAPEYQRLSDVEITSASSPPPLALPATQHYTPLLAPHGRPENPYVLGPKNPVVPLLTQAAMPPQHPETKGGDIYKD